MQAHEDVKPDLIPVLQVFQRLHVCKTKGWKLVMDGELETVKIGRLSYCTEDMIQRYIASKLVKQDSIGKEKEAWKIAFS